MKCLFVKAPFAGWIVDGVKTVEFRTRETYIRGRIGIIESGTGTVIGDVVLIGSPYQPALGMYDWLLARPRRYAEPVPFEHKQGAIVWIDLEIDPDAQEIAPELGFFQKHIAERAYNAELAKWLQTAKPAKLKQGIAN